MSADYLDETVRLNESDPAVRAVWWTAPILVSDDIRRDHRFPPALRNALEREGYRAIMATSISVAQLAQELVASGDERHGAAGVVQLVRACGEAGAP